MIIYEYFRGLNDDWRTTLDVDPSQRRRSSHSIHKTSKGGDLKIAPLMLIKERSLERPGGISKVSMLIGGP